MEWRSLHHPDWCPTVLRRRISEELLDAVAQTALMLATRGRSLWGSYYDSENAYYTAMSRLRKSGLIAYRRTKGRLPVLCLTEAGARSVSPACRRIRPWPRRWDGIWYLLTYDVPESARAYRVVAALKVIFFSRHENDRILRLLPAEPQNRRIPNRRMSKESRPSRIPTFEILRS